MSLPTLGNHGARGAARACGGEARPWGSSTDGLAGSSSQMEGKTGFRHKEGVLTSLSPGFGFAGYWKVLERSSGFWGVAAARLGRAIPWLFCVSGWSRHLLLCLWGLGGLCASGWPGCPQHRPGVVPGLGGTLKTQGPVAVSPSFKIDLGIVAGCAPQHIRKGS